MRTGLRITLKSEQAELLRNSSWNQICRYALAGLPARRVRSPEASTELETFVMNTQLWACSSDVHTWRANRTIPGTLPTPTQTRFLDPFKQPGDVYLTYGQGLETQAGQLHPDSAFQR